MPWWQYAEFDWDDGNVEHLIERHRISPDRAEDAVRSTSSVYRSGDRYEARGEDDDGHPLFIIFERRRGMVRVISPRPMNRSGKKRRRHG